MPEILVVAMIGAVSLLYATAGQAGGTAFVAVTGLAAFPAAQMRPPALVLNVVAAGYATWRLRASGAFDARAFALLAVPSAVAAFVGGVLVLDERIYSRMTGSLLLAAGALLVVKHNSVRRLRQPEPGLVALAGGATAKEAAAISPPFILCNSVVGLAGVLVSGQSTGSLTSLYAAAALAGAAIGSVIARRAMSERSTRLVMAALLTFAGVRLAFR